MIYALIWFAAFVGISAIDAVWHLVLFGKIYGADIRNVAPVVDGKVSLQPVPGLLSQVLVVSCLVVLVILSVRAGQGWGLNFLAGALGGVLAISVYGLVNQALIAGWTWRLTILEVVWGPIIGGLGGLFVAWLYRVLT